MKIIVTKLGRAAFTMCPLYEKNVLWTLLHSPCSTTAAAHVPNPQYQSPPPCIVQLKDLKRQVRDVGSALQLSGAVQTQAGDMALQLAPDWFSTRRMNGHLLASACVFITGRLNQLPVTLISAANAAQVKPFVQELCGDGTHLIGICLICPWMIAEMKSCGTWETPVGSSEYSNGKIERHPRSGKRDLEC